MKRLVHIGVAGVLLAFSAAAQNSAMAGEDLAKAKAKAEAQAVEMQMKMVGAVKGMTVKGAPYSGEEVNQTDQALADGTRIHRENRTTVYRDSEGRTRRETPDNITITDPVANVTYFLNPKTLTGQKLAMAAGNFAFMRTVSSGAGPNGEPATLSIHSSGEGPATISVNGTPVDEKVVAEAMAKARASGAPQTFTYERREVTTAVGSGSGTGVGWAVGGGVTTAGPMKEALRKSAGEPLGKQTIEGVNAEGTRNVTTLDVGAIGNDRPIQISSESWYSPDLQMMIMSKHSDPRTGDESFRLTNISRSEPAAYLFQPPAGYQITERK